jgi:ABC-type lipoprotein export system ATPase subunit
MNVPLMVLGLLSDDRRSQQRRDQFGFVFQSGQLVPELTAEENSVSGELVTNLLTAAARERGTTVIVVTHDARVAACADREIVVSDSKVSTLTGAQG